MPLATKALLVLLIVNKMNRFFLFVFFFAILVGCSSIGMETSANVTVAPSLSLPLTKTITASPTTIEPKLTPTTFISLYPTPNAYQGRQQCLTIVLDPAQLPSDSSRKVVIDSFFAPKWVESSFEQPYLFNSPTDKEILSTNYRIYDPRSFAISPDQKIIAVLYTDWDNQGSKSYLSSFDQFGNKVIDYRILPENTHNPRIYGWFEKGMIIEDKTNFGSVNETTRYLLIDPDTLDQLPLQVSFPNLYPPNAKYHGKDEIYYDPSLTRVVFYGWDKAADKLFYSLWDVSHDEEITRLYVTAFPQGDGSWSPNGEFFIIPIWLGKQYGMIGIHRDGRLETILNDDENKYQFSPDSQQIAFWHKDDTTDTESLFILDMAVGEIVDYCLKTRELVDMVWSPDSKNMAASFEYQGTVITTVIDFDQRIAVKIDDIASPVGWLR